MMIVKRIAKQQLHNRYVSKVCWRWGLGVAGRQWKTRFSKNEWMIWGLKSWLIKECTWNGTEGELTCTESLQGMAVWGTENYSWENWIYILKAHEKAVGFQGTNTVNGRQLTQVKQWTQKIIHICLKAKTNFLKTYLVCSKFHFTPKWNYVYVFFWLQKLAI